MMQELLYVDMALGFGASETGYFQCISILKASAPPFQYSLGLLTSRTQCQLELNLLVELHSRK